jgi:exodeoxyribonuclease VII small subunit
MTAKKEPANEEKTLTMEETTKRLTTIVDDLESGELPLERALLLFEEGVRLSKSAQAQIERAEKRVEELLSVDPSGRPVTKELDRASLSRGHDRSDPRRSSE